MHTSTCKESRRCSPRGLNGLQWGTESAAHSPWLFWSGDLSRGKATRRESLRRQISVVGVGSRGKQCVFGKDPCRHEDRVSGDTAKRSGEAVVPSWNVGECRRGSRYRSRYM